MRAADEMTLDWAEWVCSPFGSMAVEGGERGRREAVRTGPSSPDLPSPTLASNSDLASASSVSVLKLGHPRGSKHYVSTHPVSQSLEGDSARSRSGGRGGREGRTP